MGATDARAGSFGGALDCCLGPVCQFDSQQGIESGPLTRMDAHFLPMSFEKYRQKYRQKEKWPGVFRFNRFQNLLRDTPLINCRLFGFQ